MLLLDKEKGGMQEAWMGLIMTFVNDCDMCKRGTTIVTADQEYCGMNCYSNLLKSKLYAIQGTSLQLASTNTSQLS